MNEQKKFSISRYINNKHKNLNKEFKGPKTLMIPDFNEEWRKSIKNSSKNQILVENRDTITKCKAENNILDNIKHAITK